MQSLKDRIDLRELVTSALGSGKRAGRALQFHSPFREDHKPSFAVYQNRYIDFATGESGDVLDWLQNYDNLDFKDAVAKLRELVGEAPAALPVRQMQARPPVEGAALPPPDTWQAQANRAVAQAVDYLWSGAADAQKVLAYLREERGLTDDTIRRHELGYNPTWRRVGWQGQGEERRALTLAPGVVIPWKADGATWAVRVRCRVGNLAAALDVPDDRHRDGDTLPKYLSLGGSQQSAALFNADALTAGRPTLFVEGEFDAMLAAQTLGSRAAVVTLGSATGSLAGQWRDKLNGDVFSLLDADAAGQRGTVTLDKALPDAHRALRLPHGGDVTDFVMAGGDLGAVLDTGRAWFPAGVPDSYRTAMLTYLSPSAAPLVELVNAAVVRGLIDPDGFTAAELLEAGESLGWSLPGSTVRRVLSELSNPTPAAQSATSPSPLQRGRGQGEGVNGFFSKLVAVKHPEREAANSEKNVGGRPQDVYSLLPLPEIRTYLLRCAARRLVEKCHPVTGEVVLALLDEDVLREGGAIDPDEDAATILTQLEGVLKAAYVQQSRREVNAARRAAALLQALKDSLHQPDCTELHTGFSINSVQAYRAAYLRGRFNGAPDESRSRKAVADLLGIKDSSVPAYLQRAGLVNEPQYASAAIESAHDVGGQVRAIARREQGFPLQLVAESADGETRQIYYRPEEARAFVRHYKERGYSVRVRLQVASVQRVAPEKPPDPPPRSSAPRRTATVKAASTQESPKSFYEPRYNPDWVRGQLALALKLLGRVVPEYVIVAVGSAPREVTAKDLLDLLLERRTGWFVDEQRRVWCWDGDDIDSLAVLGAWLGGRVSYEE